MKGLSISEEQIKYVISRYPESYGNNSIFLRFFYEIVCEQRGIPTSWENIAVIMTNDYKPENVMRKRRKHVESTPEQLDKEFEVREEYSVNNPSMG